METRSTEVGVVRLLQTVKLPPRHQKLLPVEVDSPHKMEGVMSEPDIQFRDLLSFSMPMEDGRVSLLLENWTSSATQLLEKGCVLGQVHSAIVHEDLLDAIGSDKDSFNTDMTCFLPGTDAPSLTELVPYYSSCLYRLVPTPSQKDKVIN